MSDIRDNPDCPTVGSTWFLDSPPATAHVTGFLGTSQLVYSVTAPAGCKGVVGYVADLPRWLARHPVLVDGDDDPSTPVGPPDFVEAVDRRRAGSQVGGDHYERMGVQPWDVIEASPWLDYWTGTALKYVMRAGRGRASKVEDLRKAAHFIAKAIELEEKA